MSKKKRENVVPNSDDAAMPEKAAANVPSAPEGGLVASSAGSAAPLLAEVQLFLSRREELARKLADEIAVTEARLAELKRTAAALFPESSAAVVNVAKDKKPKKLVKAKPLPSKTDGVVFAEATPIAEAPTPVIQDASAEAATVD